MVVFDLLAAIAAAGVAFAALFLAHGRHGDDRGGPRAELVRYFGLAALSALACAVLNVLELTGGGTFAAAAGNATNVFAAALVWAGARRLNARAAIGAVSAGGGGILMLGATFLMPLDDATLLKTAGLVAFSALAAFELSRRPLRELHGAALSSWTMAAFGAFNLGRLIVATVAGMGSPLWQQVASAEATSVVSALTIVSLAAGAVRMGRELDDDPAPGTRAHDRGSLRREAAEIVRLYGTAEVVIARVPEIELIRAAHSSDDAEAVLTALVDAARTALPGGTAGVPARDTVFALVPPTGDPSADTDAIRHAFAERLPLIGYADTPDVSFEIHRVDDIHDLSLLMESRRLRPRQDLPH